MGGWFAFLYSSLKCFVLSSLLSLSLAAPAPEAAADADAALIHPLLVHHAAPLLWFLQEGKGGQLRLKLRLLLTLPQKPKLRLKQLLHLLPSTPCLWLLTTLMVLCPQWPCAAPAMLLSTMLVLLTTPGCTPSMWYLLVASAGMLMLKLMPTLSTQL